MSPEDIKKAIETAYREGYRSAMNMYDEFWWHKESEEEIDMAWKNSQAHCFTENGVR